MAGWLAAYLPYHTQGITPSTTLSAIFPYCSWRISKHSHCTCVWKEGGVYFKEEKVPCFWLWGLKLTTHSVLHGPVILGVKRGANAGLFPLCYVKKEPTCD